MADPVVEVVGVYDADGGVVGEVTYVVQHLLGRAECSLCDITHGGLRRKRAWDEMAARLPVPVRLLHRNETTPGERDAAAASGLPVVLGVRPDGSFVTLLPPAALAEAGGSVEAFERALREALAAEAAA